jgi:hypothetical protein
MVCGTVQGGQPKHGAQPGRKPLPQPAGPSLRDPRAWAVLRDETEPEPRAVPRHRPDCAARLDGGPAPDRRTPSATGDGKKNSTGRLCIIEMGIRLSIEAHKNRQARKHLAYIARHSEQELKPEEMRRLIDDPACRDFKWLGAAGFIGALAKRARVRPGHHIQRRPMCQAGGGPVLRSIPSERRELYLRPHFLSCNLSRLFAKLAFTMFISSSGRR